MSSPEEDLSPADYAERIARVRREAVEGLRLCRGDVLAQLRVCCRYFQHGKQEGISHGELIDFLGVSTPSVLDDAGYDAAEALCIMKALVLITCDEDGHLEAPSVLPTPHPPFTPPEQKEFDL